MPIGGAPFPGRVQSPVSEEGVALLYFAYDANIEPGRLAEVAPGAFFEFIAHLPEWKMEWPIQNGAGGLPSVRPLPGNTVWGAVFAVPDPEVGAIDDLEADEGRIRVDTQAMDRAGRRHDVVTHVIDGDHDKDFSPEKNYLELMVAGSRHWSLPAGWVASLEEHLEG